MCRTDQDDSATPREAELRLTTRSAASSDADASDAAQRTDAVLSLSGSRHPSLRQLLRLQQTAQSIFGEVATHVRVECDGETVAEASAGFGGRWCYHWPASES